MRKHSGQESVGASDATHCEPHFFIDRRRRTDLRENAFSARNEHVENGSQTIDIVAVRYVIIVKLVSRNIHLRSVISALEKEVTEFGHFLAYKAVEMNETDGGDLLRIKRLTELI